MDIGAFVTKKCVFNCDVTFLTHLVMYLETVLLYFDNFFASQKV